MRIIHISTNDILGGAAPAAYRLHKGLRRLGQDSNMFVAYRHSDDSAIQVFQPSTDLRTRFRRRIYRDRVTRVFARYHNTRPDGYELFSDDRSQHGGDLLTQLPDCNIINLHWVAGFVDYHAFFAYVPQDVPIVWTLHDMNPFTGGCHYDHGCGGYLKTCGACPQLGSSDPGDLSNQVWQRKYRLFGNLPPERLHVVAPSHWLADEAYASSLLRRFPITTIPYGVDVHDFSPRDVAVARDVLGIPQDREVILFAAQSTDNRRKGFPLLMEALRGLAGRNRLFLISLGEGRMPVDDDLPHLHLGHLNNDRFLSLVYSAADVFVIPSLQDNLPNTVLESLACGTPVVGFAVGGIPDMVRPGITGLLAPPEDVGALRVAIAQMLDHPEKRREMAENCRRIVVEEYSIEMQARQYLSLYKSLLFSMPSSSGQKIVQDA